LVGEVLFNGRSEAEQLVWFISLLGTPTRQDMVDMRIEQIQWERLSTIIGISLILDSLK